MGIEWSERMQTSGVPRMAQHEKEKQHKENNKQKQYKMNVWDGMISSLWDPFRSWLPLNSSVWLRQPCHRRIYQIKLIMSMYAMYGNSQTHTHAHTHTQLVNACLDNVYACHPSHKHTITLSMRVMMRQKCVSTCVYKDKSLRESFHLVSVSENKHKSVSVYHLGQCWVKQRTQQTKKHKSLRNLLSFHKC